MKLINFERLNMSAWRRLAMLALLASASMASGMVIADGGRDFAGGYEVSGAQTLSANTTRVTLRVRIQNVSGQAAQNGQVILIDPSGPIQIGRFTTPLALQDRGVGYYQGVFDVQRRLADSWIVGRPPQVVVRIVNAAGIEVERPVEMTRMPIATEGQP